MCSSKRLPYILLSCLAVVLLMISACKASGGTPITNPDTASVVSVDRFSDAFAHLFARSKNSSFPAANAPINFDQEGPFITHGLGPQGGKVTYYNFDVLPTKPAPIYVLFKQGDSNAVSGQLNIIDVIPGDPGYNDFWNVYKVTVPSNYVPNTVTSLSQILAAGYPSSSTTMLVNCPVVPDGSTARLRYNVGESAALQRGWYKGKVVKYFTFAERTLSTDSNGMVPLADIFVTFNINPSPSDSASGPPSGFKTESGTTQTHNVPNTLPENNGYSPLWNVDVYDNAAFNGVANLVTATQAPILAKGAAVVNCPIVAKQ